MLDLPEMQRKGDEQQHEEDGGMVRGCQPCGDWLVGRQVGHNGRSIEHPNSDGPRRVGNTAALQEAKEAGTPKTQQIIADHSRSQYIAPRFPLRGEWIHVGGVGRRRCC